MNRPKGKRDFVTAAGAGIGGATATAFANEGAEVFATDVKSELLDRLGERGIAATRRLGVRDTAAVGALAEQTGPIDVLLNCAGFVHHGTVLTTSEGDRDFAFDVKVKSMHRTISAILPGMIDKGGGAIVNVSSVASLVRGIPNRYVYGASEAAAVGPTKSVAADFIRQGICANASCPGAIRSPSLDGRIESRPRRPASGSPRHAMHSSAGSRWHASAPPKRSPGWPSISPRTSQATQRV